MHTIDHNPNYEIDASNISHTVTNNIPATTDKSVKQRQNKTNTDDIWKIMYANVRGMKSKINSLIEVLQDHNPHVFLITETQLKSDTGIKVSGYTIYSRARPQGTGGGVAILVRNDIIQHTAPHISDRQIELIWVSIRRKNKRPIFIGSYYGKQESRVNKDEIEKEMTLLQEEITEMKEEGEIFLGMDGNGKVGILNESPSRNGKLLQQVFDNTDLILMNNSDKCIGKITRKNTNNVNEVSAIDFITVSEYVEKWIKKIIIDEDGLATIKGKKNSDHNTIITTLSVEDIDCTRVVKKTGWKLRASTEKWCEFSGELLKRQLKATKIIKSDKPMNQRYKLWMNEIDQAARLTIGKTTTKQGGKENFSSKVREMNNQKIGKKSK